MGSFCTLGILIFSGFATSRQFGLVKQNENDELPKHQKEPIYEWDSPFILPSFICIRIMNHTPKTIFLLSFISPNAKFIFHHPIIE